MIKKSKKHKDKTFEQHLDAHMKNIQNTPVHVKRQVRKHIKSFHKVLREGDPPEKIAFSFALGVFIAFLPILWFHIFILIPLMLWTRINKLALVLGTFLLHPLALYILTPVSYKLGAHLLDFQAPALTLKTIHLAYPSLLLGSLIFGAIFGITFYFITYFAVIKYREKKDKKKNI